MSDTPSPNVNSADASVPESAPLMDSPALKSFLARLAAKEGVKKTKARGAFGGKVKHNHTKGAFRERLGRGK